MVFFTCNHCGESAKKPSVEKHYNTKCRGAPVFVSCMDCQKDFRDQEYVEHTKCISEAEKYSGKGYVPKESLNKGQKKQDSWLEIVRSILTTSEYNLSPAIKIVFQRLQSYDNVPRKGSKFENFVSNSMRINKNQAKEVWKILEKELNKLKKSNIQSKTTNGDVKESNGHSENGDVKNAETDLITVETDLIPETIELNETDKPKKVKKSKKRSLENDNIELNEIPDKVEVADEPKQKKKKSKNETIVEETELIKEINTNGNKIENDGTFNWYNVISEFAKDGLSVEKLKKKVLKKHKSIIGHDESTNLNKLEKTFKKYLKKSGLILDNDTIKINE